MLNQVEIHVIKKLLFFILSSALVFAATVYFRLGAYKPVKIEYSEYPELFLLYKEHMGPYHKINETIEQVEQFATLNHIPCLKTFGEYLDDPRQVEERRLRSNGGCVLNSTMVVDPALLKDTEIKFKHIDRKKYVLATFDGAPSISPIKVYPKVENFISEHKLQNLGTTFEIYSILSSSEAHTEYLFPVTEK
jgi:AraC family transcriptional regulator